MVAKLSQLTFNVQVNDCAHFGIRADLTLVAGAIIQANILDFEYPIMAPIIVDGGKPWIADVGVFACC